MSLNREHRLKALGLWPVWRLRAPNKAEDFEAVLEAGAPGQSSSPVEGGGAPVLAPKADPRVEAAGLTPAPDLSALDLDGLASVVQACGRCALAQSRTRGVPGVGDPHAEWLFIGEAPGADEDRLGEPFVGQAGKLLDAMMAGIGLQRGRNVYIANILKSRPPGNRDPRPDEVAACLPYLERQIGLIKPKLIVVLGRIAAQTLLVTDTPIGRLRGHVHQYQGVAMVVTYHPAYLLRNPADKAKAWEDLVLARHTLATLKTAPIP